MQNKLHISFTRLPCLVKDTEFPNKKLILHRYLKHPLR
jgi:hypothetical protein